MPFAYFIQLPIPSGSDDSGECCTMNYTVVVEREDTDTGAEDGEEGRDAVGDDQVAGIVAIDVLG